MAEAPQPRPYPSSDERRAFEEDIRSRLEEMDIPWPDGFIRLSVRTRFFGAGFQPETTVGLPPAIAAMTKLPAQLEFSRETNHGLKLALIQSLVDHPGLEEANMVEIEFADGGAFMWSEAKAVYSHLESKTGHEILEDIDAFAARRRGGEEKAGRSD